MIEDQSLGRKLWVALKCGTFDRALEILADIADMPEDSSERVSVPKQAFEVHNILFISSNIP